MGRGTHFHDIVGKKFGKLTGVCPVLPKQKYTKAYWIFKCDCGRVHIAERNNVKQGLTKSCGCLHDEVARKRQYRHGKTNTSTYISWVSMRQRCENQKHTAYKRYGGRGINVCDKWECFDGFFEDMGERPSGRTLDRIDNNKGYFKENCRWATPKEQMENTERTKRSRLIIQKKRERKIITSDEKSMVKDMPRDEQIRFFIKQDKTLRIIANIYGLTHQRVHQIKNLAH